jgi:flavin-dependent dehydrogenase
MNRVSYDLIVIGGGPGGSCAASLARKKNLRVLLV